MTSFKSAPTMNNEVFKVSKTIAFDGTSGLGATGTTNIFTVTGDVIVYAFATCSETLVGATAQVALGCTGNTGAFISNTTATGIQVNMVWRDTTPAVSKSVAASFMLSGSNINYTVSTAAVTDGTLTFYALWRPLSANGSIVAA